MTPELARLVNDRAAAGLLTPAISKLIADAAAAGFTITWDANRLAIAKGPYRRGLPHRGVMLYLTPTGGFYDAHRIDVELSLALKINSIKLVRRILEL